MINFFKLFLIAIFLISLTGCSKEPSQTEIYSEIETALLKDYSDLINKKLFGISAANVIGINGITINKIEKISCAPIEKNATICDVLVDYNFETSENSLHDIIFQSNNRDLMHYKFIKTKNGWSYLKEQ